VGGEGLLRIQPVEGGLPREHLVAHDAERVDVESSIEVRIGCRLFRRHVGRSAQRDSRRGELLASRRFGDCLGDAKVHDHRVATGEQDVLGLDIAVDHAVPMGHGQRLGDFPQESYGFGNRKLTGAGEPFPERLALHVRHDVVEKSVSLSRVEQAEDVRVLEPGGDFDLAGETLEPHRGGKIGPEHLDRDVPMVAEVLGEINRGHATLSEFSLEAVAVGQGGGESRIDGQWSMVSDCRLLIADCRLVRAEPRAA
jgi:hypothetical protein